MIGLLDALLFGGGLCLVGGLSTAAFVLACNPPEPRPELGSRGLKRHRALQSGGSFAVVEPLVRLVGGWHRELPLGRLRARIEREIVHAGDYLGLNANELIAMCGLAAATLGTLGLVGSNLLGWPTSIALTGLLLGATVPWFRVTGAAAARARSVDRALPGKVDLASLCMGAGLDFPGALRQIVTSAADQNEPAIEEFRRLLQELELGYTRRRALENFADRVPTDAVKEFVNSVVQAEEKGNPLSRVLTIQAKTQRMRRSVAAEEAASRAAIMLFGPMTMIFVVIIVLLLGPMLVRFMTGTI